MASISISDFISQTLTPTFTGTGYVTRVPFSFTSTARLVKSGKLQALGQDMSKVVSQANLNAELQAIEAETRPVTTSLTSLETLVGTTLPTGMALPIISMAVNPNTIKWTQPKRFSKRDTQEGSVFFHFTNTNDQDNDILTIQFSGQTGNINTNVNVIDAATIGSNLKLRIWHELYNLSREGLLLNSKNCNQNFGHAVRNQFFITYKTALMKVPITLIGFFNQVLDFTETAQDPFNRNYNFAFTVLSTSPSLDDISSRLQTSLALNNFSPLPVNI